MIFPVGIKIYLYCISEKFLKQITVRSLKLTKEANLKRKWLSKVKPNIAVGGSYDPPDTLDRTPERLRSFYLTL